ncbi:MAG: NRDE family protein [Verrucomicrobiota bacterium]
MCTATWWTGADGYELFFNRDELKSRAPGLPPKNFSLNGVRYLAPIDSTAGGTWLVVNEFGLSICLINQYPDGARNLGVLRISRGLLVRSLADCRDCREVKSRLARMDLIRYDAFLLIAVEASGAACTHTWDTWNLISADEAQGAQPFTSSRHMSADVLRSRRRRFAELVKLRGGDPSPNDLRAFHEYYAPETAAHSVFMNRPDGETVSLTHVVVNHDQIVIEYAPRLPGEFRFDRATQLTLQRVDLGLSISR